MPQMKKVLLDTDIGNDIDDALALAYLLMEPECELLGVTTVSGQPETRARMVNAICRAAGKPEIPVYAGLAGPLLGRQKQPVARQAECLCNWAHSLQRHERDAISFLRETVRANPGEVTLLGVGPLTNLAVLFAIDPENGQLERKFSLPISGEYPKSMKLFPDGKHIAIVNHESSSITTFTIDYEKNVLMMKGKPMSVDTPNCILIEEVSPENTI